MEAVISLAETGWTEADSVFDASNGVEKFTTDPSCFNFTIENRLSSPCTEFKSSKNTFLK